MVSSSGRGVFSDGVVAYLASLPVVASVSRERIVYADGFKVECMRRYCAGERASAIFRSVGLDPKLVGAKRVERCVNRWRHDESIMRRALGQDTDSETDGQTTDNNTNNTTTNRQHNGTGEFDIVSARVLAEHIQKLEQQVAILRQQLTELERNGATSHPN
ncbi:hypothetical protein [Bifidobacterium oedipodis]|uniref:Transposase n=1 Tax=Bifidobacterium oedipodis TaxID=2675322 RepID=A0A7Y0HTK0_9BIFI|nr:hypothetical protein [Bifidobacterium sp. DSM 109957]NMM94187.1 transposase [Bifidobacterium sp. DSM 109957]